MDNKKEEQNKPAECEETDSTESSFLDKQYKPNWSFFEREAFLQATTIDELKIFEEQLFSISYLIFITFHM